MTDPKQNVKTDEAPVRETDSHATAELASSGPGRLQVVFLASMCVLALIVTITAVNLQSATAPVNCDRIALGDGLYPDETPDDIRHCVEATWCDQEGLFSFSDAARREQRCCEDIDVESRTGLFDAEVELTEAETGNRLRWC